MNWIHLPSNESAEFTEFIYAPPINSCTNRITTITVQANEENTVAMLCNSGLVITKLCMKPGQIVPIDLILTKFSHFRIESTRPIIVKTVNTGHLSSELYLAETNSQSTDVISMLTGDEIVRTFTNDAADYSVQLPVAANAIRTSHIMVERAGLESVSLDLNNTLTDFARESAHNGNATIFIRTPIRTCNACMLHIKGGSGPATVRVHGFNVMVKGGDCVSLKYQC